MQIHFLCRGNILRSVIAEAYLKSLNLKNVSVLSSGTNVNWQDPTEKQYYTNSMKLLGKHNIDVYAKEMPEQLTQSRISDSDIIICMNQRVMDEAHNLIDLPQDTINWNSIDIGEAHRIQAENRKLYEEEIYKEITEKVDELVKDLALH